MKLTHPYTWAQPRLYSPPRLIDEATRATSASDTTPSFLQTASFLDSWLTSAARIRWSPAASAAATSLVHSALKSGALLAMASTVLAEPGSDRYIFRVGYDEFSDKLQKLKAEFRQSRGKELETVQELEKYLDARLAKRPKSRGARSLRGILP